MSDTKETKKPGSAGGSPERQPGSPVTGEPAFLVVGRFHQPHGLYGEIRMEVMTDFPERLQPGVTVYIGATHKPLQIHSRRWHRDSLLLAFDSIENPETIRKFSNEWIFVSSENRPALTEGEYYHHQLLGLQVKSDEGFELGKMTGILETGANDVFMVLTPSGRELLLPAIESVVLEISLERGEILVHLLPGMLDN